MLKKDTVLTQEEADNWKEKFFPGQACPLAGFATCDTRCPAYLGPYYVFDKTAQEFILTPGQCQAPILVARNLLMLKN
jgi:hypothetical protein